MTPPRLRGRTSRLVKAILALAALAGLWPRPLAGAGEVVSFGRFGPVTIYRGSRPPSRVVLFVSGDGGWNLGVVDMARSLAGLDALVAGIDITKYLKELSKSGESCLYPAADLEALSKFVQKKLDFPEYLPPALVGYSSGATLVYATLVQAPPTTFKGAISLGFCPDLDLPQTLCRGSGLEWKSGRKPHSFVFLPAPALEAPWIALQGLDDKVCDPASTEAFVRATGKAAIVKLPKVGHGFAVQKNWLPQFKEAFERIFTEPPVEQPAVVPSLEDLPLVEVPARGAERDLLAVLVTGDGGYGVTDRGISEDLASNGIPVVALNSLKYFWVRKTPDIASRDLGRILGHYLSVWRKKRVVLIGYSLGADVMPFMLNGLPENGQSSVTALVLMGPSETVEFEFHLMDWVGRTPGKGSLPVVPEINRVKKDIPVLCVFGQEDDAQVCRRLDPGRTKSISVQAGHRFGRNFAPISAAILEMVHGN